MCEECIKEHYPEFVGVEVIPTAPEIAVEVIPTAPALTV